MKKYEGTVRIGDKDYFAEVINGECFIDGKSVDEFLEILSPDLVMRFNKLGKRIVQDKALGIKRERGWMDKFL